MERHSEEATPEARATPEAPLRRDRAALRAAARKENKLLNSKKLTTVPEQRSEPSTDTAELLVYDGPTFQQPEFETTFDPPQFDRPQFDRPEFTTPAFERPTFGTDEDLKFDELIRSVFETEPADESDDDEASLPSTRTGMTFELPPGPDFSPDLAPDLAPIIASEPFQGDASDPELVFSMPSAAPETEPI